MNQEEEVTLFSFQLKITSTGHVVFDKQMFPVEELDNPDIQGLPITELKEYLPLLSEAYDLLFDEGRRIFKH